MDNEDKEFHSPKRSNLVDIRVKPRIQDQLDILKPEATRYEYTPLRVPQLKILQQIESVGILEKPTKMFPPPEKRNKAKYCHFHKDHGHEIEQCNELKKAIENAIKKKELKEFIDNAFLKEDIRS